MSIPAYMSWGLWFLAAILFAEVGRFLHSEVQRRRFLDSAEFPPDPRRAARLSHATLESSDRAESERGLGLIVRMDAALAALLSALGYSISGIFSGAIFAKGLIFWVALALGPAQFVFLVPAFLIGINTRQPRALRSILLGALPAFAVSGLCALWLVFAPPPGSQPASHELQSPAEAAAASPGAPATIAATPPTYFFGRSYSASLPEGWRVIEDEGGGLWRQARFEAPWPGGPNPIAYVRLESRIGPDDPILRDRHLAGLGKYGVDGANSVSSGESGSLGEFPAHHRSSFRMDGAGRREMRELWAAASDEAVFLVECFGREPEVAQAEAACKLFVSTFRRAETSGR